MPAERAGERAGAGAARGACTGGFRHEALLYSGERGFLAGTLPFIAQAIARGEPTLVAVAPAKIALLRRALPGAVPRVLFADMSELGANPARIIPAWRRFLDEHAPDGRPVRGIAEPMWPGRGAAERAQCQRHEALANLAFAGGQPWSLLCPYDVDALEPDVLRAARETHPVVRHDGGRRRRCEDFLSARPDPWPFDCVLEPPAGEVLAMTFTGEALGALRATVAQRAGGTLDAGRVDDLVLASGELATNSVRHAGGRGELRMWSEGETLLCEVSDRGRISDPLAGRVRPPLAQPSGRGLFLVNQLCDLVQIRSTIAGTAVRVHMRARPERAPRRPADRGLRARVT